MNKISSLQLISVRWWNANAHYAIKLAQVLNNHNYYSIVGGNPDTPPMKVAKEIGLPILADIKLESLSPFQAVKNYSFIKNWLKNNNIHIINAHRPEDHLFSGLIGRKFQHIPIIRTVCDVRSPKDNPVNKWLHLRATDFFIFSCKANKERYLKVWQIPDKKTKVIYDAVDINHFKPPLSASPLRKKLKIPEKAITFGMVGRLSPVKDHNTFLKAASKNISSLDNAYYIVSGKEVEISHQDLKQKAQQLGILNKFHFLDKKYDVREIISAIDVGIICSYDSEAVSRIAAEFLAMGKPIIVTNVNVLPEMIQDNKQGFVIPVQSPELLSKKMEELMRSPNLRNEMSKNARKTAESRFSFTRFLNETLNVYHQVLREKIQ